MKLIVHELKSTLTQRITVGNRFIALYAIRPHLYRHLNPAGSLYLEIKKTNGDLVATSESIAIEDLGDDDYCHGVFRFRIDAILAPLASYDVILNATGYTFDEASYIGWCNDFDLRIVDADYSPNVGQNAALRMEFWEYKQAGKG